MNFKSIDISTITYINIETILMVSKEKFWKSGSKYADMYWLFLIRFHHKMANRISKTAKNE